MCDTRPRLAQLIKIGLRKNNARVIQCGFNLLFPEFSVMTTTIHSDAQAIFCVVETRIGRKMGMR